LVFAPTNSLNLAWYQQMALTDVQIRSLKGQSRPKKYSDAGGLHLLVTPSGSKLWRLQYRFHDKQRTLAFGSYPAVSLADARKRRDEAKKHLAAGLDPSHQAKIEKAVSRTSNETTFSVIADEFLSKVKREGKAAATITKKKWLVDLARADLGKRPIAEITAAEILAPLRKVEANGNYETARRLRSTIGQVFRYAVATGRALNDPTGALRGALTAPVVTHRAAATNREAFAGVLRAIWAYDGMPETRAALKLMAILYPRPGELRQPNQTLHIIHAYEAIGSFCHFFIPCFGWGPLAAARASYGVKDINERVPPPLNVAGGSSTCRQKLIRGKSLFIRYVERASQRSRLTRER